MLIARIYERGDKPPHSDIGFNSSSELSDHKGKVVGFLRNLGYETRTSHDIPEHASPFENHTRISPRVEHADALELANFCLEIVDPDDLVLVMTDRMPGDPSTRQVEMLAESITGAQ